MYLNLLTFLLLFLFCLSIPERNIKIPTVILDLSIFFFFSFVDLLFQVF